MLHSIYFVVLNLNINAYWSVLWIVLLMQSLPVTTKVVSSNSTHSEVYSIQHYMIQFVSDLWQVSGFLRVLRLWHVRFQLSVISLFLPRTAHCGGLGKCAVVRCTYNGKVCLYLSKGDKSGRKYVHAIFPLVLFMPNI
jgi:hypothetical protein